MTRIFLAGIFHETHSFTDDRTGIDGFIIHRGQALLDRIGDGSQVDGFLTTAKREGWEVVPAATYLCGASGMVEHAVFEAFWDETRPVLVQAIADGLDGIFLSLAWRHGHHRTGRSRWRIADAHSRHSRRRSSCRSSASMTCTPP